MPLLPPSPLHHPAAHGAVPVPLQQGEPAPPPTDMSIARFGGHGDGFVLAVDWHPDGARVASGGEDDKGYIWTVRPPAPVPTPNAHPPAPRACVHGRHI